MGHEGAVDDGLRERRLVLVDHSLEDDDVLRRMLAGFQSTDADG